MSETQFFSTGIRELNDLLTRDEKKGLAIPGTGNTASCQVVIKGGAGTGKSILSSLLAYNLHLRATPSSSLFSAVDIKDTQALVEKLRDRSNRISTYFFKRFSSSVRRLLRGSEPPIQPILDELNGIVHGITPSIGRDMLEQFQDFLAGHYQLTAEGRYLPFCVYFSFAQPADGLVNYVQTIRLGRSIIPKAKFTDVFPVFLSPKNVQNAVRSGGGGTLKRLLLDNLEPLLSTDSARATTWNQAPHGATVYSTLQKCLDRLRQSREWIVAPNDDANEWKLPRNGNPGQPGGTGDLLQSADSVRLRPIVFVDPINFFFDFRDSRLAIAELFEVIRNLRWLMVLILEDAESLASEAHRQLTSQVEFEADTVIRLRRQDGEYVRTQIEVLKNRNSQSRFGAQVFRIETPKHALRNVPSHWTNYRCWDESGNLREFENAGKQEQEEKKLITNHPGVLILKSIHWHISEARKRHESVYRYVTGIRALDQILVRGHSTDEPRLLPADAFILLHGKKSGHKLSVALNLLVAGLWNPRSKDKKADSRSVLLLSLCEETRIEIGEIGLSAKIGLRPPTQKLSESFDNAEKISEFRAEIRAESNSKGSKVMVHKRDWLDNKRNVVKDQHLIEVTFEPGYLGVEEFLWVIRSLVETYRPSRILIDNTAHLKMRFPELGKERMLFPAISNYTQSEDIMLIVIDVEADGSDEGLSYGLAASADYLLKLEQVELGSNADREGTRPNANAKARMTRFKKALKNLEKQEIGTVASLVVSNVRRKNYLRPLYWVTVAPRLQPGTRKTRNLLYFVEVQTPQTLST